MEKIDLGENVSTGAVAVGTSWVFVGDGPNRQVIVVLPNSRKVFKRIKLRAPPHDMGLTSDGDHLWVALEGGWVADIEIDGWKVTYARVDFEARRIAVTNARRRRSRQRRRRAVSCSGSTRRHTSRSASGSRRTGSRSTSMPTATRVNLMTGSRRH